MWSLNCEQVIIPIQTDSISSDISGHESPQADPYPCKWRKKSQALKEQPGLYSYRRRRRALCDERDILVIERDQLVAELEHSRVLHGWKEAASSRETQRSRQLLDQYFMLVGQADRLREENQVLRKDLRKRDECAAAISRFLHEEKMAHSTAESTPTQLPLSVNPRVFEPTKPSAPVEIALDPVAMLKEALLADPLTLAEAHAFVETTCREMVETMSQTQVTNHCLGDGSIDDVMRGLVIDRLGETLDFCLTRHVESISAAQLMDKTWTLLTELDGYRQIQPQVKQLQVLQRVSKECWVVGLAVGDGPAARHALVLLARATIHGGYLITFRSLLLVRHGESAIATATRQAYIDKETNSTYGTTLSWYNFQERQLPSGAVACDVIFGGRACSPESAYLGRLSIEVHAGFTRWLAAVGVPQLVFTVPGSDNYLN